MHASVRTTTTYEAQGVLLACGPAAAVAATVTDAAALLLYTSTMYRMATCRVHRGF